MGLSQSANTMSTSAMFQTCSAMNAPSVERPAGNTVPIPVVSAPTVNNAADEDECAIVSDNDGAQCHDQLA